MRPQAAAALLLLMSCGLPRTTIWDLDEDPRLVGVRVEVVEDGPLALNLIPVPADRVPHSPLPLDTIVPRLLLLDDNGPVDAVPFDPIWLLCPGVGACFSTLASETARPCTELPFQGEACELGRGDATPFELPTTSALPAPGKTFLRLAVVSSVPGEQDSATCLERVATGDNERLAGCRIAYAPLVLGPETHVTAMRLLEDQTIAEYTPEAGQRLFNPEPATMILSADEQRFFAAPRTQTTVPPDELLIIGEALDPRDRTVGSEGVVGPFRTGARIYCNAPDVLIPTSSLVGGEVGYRIRPLESGSRFSLYVVAGSRLGGQGWARYDFEVGGA